MYKSVNEVFRRSTTWLIYKWTRSYARFKVIYVGHFSYFQLLQIFKLGTCGNKALSLRNYQMDWHLMKKTNNASAKLHLFPNGIKSHPDEKNPSTHADFAIFNYSKLQKVR